MSDPRGGPAPASSAAIGHQVLLASAGSGKTFQLTSRYLRLALLGAEPSTILASTFTRAAAGEIRDRVLARAATAASDEAAAAALLAELRVPAGDEPAQAIASRLLQRLVHSWHRLRIRTLDSFMAGIAINHALDLGVPPGAVVVDEAATSALMDEAMARTMRSLPIDAAVPMLKAMTAGRSDADVGRAVREVLGNLHGLWRETGPGPWQRVPTGEPLPADELERVLAHLAARSGSVAHAQFATGMATLLDRAHRARWDAVLESPLLQNGIKSKGTYQRKPIPDDVIEAGRLLDRHATAMVLERLRRQTMACAELIERYDGVLAEMKRERGVITFDDLPHLLVGAARLGGLEELGYRLDGAVHHLLLDEMQDTSAVQWRGLLPFASEVWSHRDGSRTFYSVGDLKQSIYGWRGASPEVLARLPETIGIAPSTLERTRRCGPEIVAAVNAVFEPIATSAVLAEKFPQAAERFGRYFRRHDTTATGPSFVELHRAAPPGEGDAGAAPRLALACRLVRQLHAEAPEATIGVLTRTNGTVNRLLAMLGGGDGGQALPVAGRGGAPLVDAPPVEAILDALQLALHPGDTAAAFNVAMSPLGGVVVPGGLAPADVASGPARGRVAAAIRHRILRVGLAEAIRSWVADIAAATDERERRRLVQLAMLAARAETQGPVGIAAFIELVERVGVPDEAAAPIQVMNVHQSKGLEFDLVVLAELDKGLVVGSPVAAFDRPDDGSAPTRVVRWVPAKARASLPVELTALFTEQRQREAMEALCLLYVAMTRAKRGLVMVVDASAKGRSRASWAALVRERLAVEVDAGSDIGAEGGAHASPASGAPVGDAASEAVLARRGDREGTLGFLRRMTGTAGQDAAEVRTVGSAAGQVPLVGQALPAAPASVVVPGAASGSGGRTMVAPPSTEAVGDPAAPLRVDLAVRRDAADRGVAVHACFACVEWLEGFAMSDEALTEVVGAAMRAAGVDGRSSTWCAERVREFRAMLARPQVAAVLRDGLDREVRRERPFLRLTANGVQRGVIDRLVLSRGAAPDGGDGGSCVSAEIVDFKTGRCPSRDPAQVQAYLAERVRGYAGQMRAYAEAVAEDWRIPRERVVTTLAFVDEDAVVRMPG